MARKERRQNKKNYISGYGGALSDCRKKPHIFGRKRSLIPGQKYLQRENRKAKNVPSVLKSSEIIYFKRYPQHHYYLFKGRSISPSKIPSSFLKT